MIRDVLGKLNPAYQLVAIVAPALVAVLIWYITKRNYQKKQEDLLDVNILKEKFSLFKAMFEHVEEEYERQISVKDTRILELEEKIKQLEA